MHIRPLAMEKGRNVSCRQCPDVRIEVTVQDRNDEVEIEAEKQSFKRIISGSAIYWVARMERERGGAKRLIRSRVMRELSCGIHSAAQIGGKHLQAFVCHRLESGIAGRTVANETSHVRAVPKHVGKQAPARNPAYSNRSLGIPQGSRIEPSGRCPGSQIRASLLD